MTKMNDFVLKMTDDKITHQVKKVYIFTNKYSRKLVKNEIHAPLAARIIVETASQMFHYLLVNAIIKVDKEGGIKIWNSISNAITTFKNSYYQKKELVEAKILNDLFSSKSKFGLSIDEISNFQRAKIINEIFKVNKLKIPHIQGGGF